VRKVIAAAPSGFVKLRGSQNEVTFLSRITIPGTYANGIVAEEGEQSIFYEAYIRENMTEGESLKQQGLWRAFLAKVLPDYTASPATRIAKDFDKSIFR